uniref:Uncharacterized protein n=1 Tax=Picea glauca TaxID=3330 RepID=A0A117NFX5_PICGL|nr:hypothetical protein ABT39_MTgene2245 [Picea glauca]
MPFVFLQTSLLLEYTKMLSEYTTTHLSNNGLNTSFMSVQNVACALHSPKGRELIRPISRNTSSLHLLQQSGPSSIVS